MNKREAQRYVYAMTAKSLRGLGRRIELKDVPDGTTEAGLAKIKKEIAALAEKLDAKFEEREPIEGEKADGSTG